MKDIIIIFLILIQIIVLFGLTLYEFKKRNLIGLLGLFCSACSLIITILTLQLNPNLWGYVFFSTEYHNGPYNEGQYSGEWRDGMPQGKGTLTYGFFGDGKYYSISANGQKYKALFYKGEFDQGYRNGEGTVTYEGGYRDEGMFYGAWVEGKMVFKGKRWLTTETFNGYCELEIYATSASTADEYWLGEWVSVDR